MTSRTLPRVVVDTNVLIDLFTGADTDLARSAQNVLDGHEKRHSVVLPAIVLTEIAGTGDIRGHHLPPNVRESRIAQAMTWIHDSRFMVAELSERLAREASQLAVAHQLKGPDATVLATAIGWRCKRLYTRDRGILKCDGQFPGLRIIQPEAPPEPDFDLFGDAIAEYVV